MPPVDTGMHLQIIGPSTIAATSGITVHKITLSGVPSGTGTYQQLITINNPANYGINSNGSNILFFDGSNHTELYAWEQSVDSSAIQVWIKNYNSSSVIDMEVLPSSDNEFSANGYIGSGRTYFNAPLVFPYATDFTNLTGLSLSNNNYSLSNGLKLDGNNGVSASGSFSNLSIMGMNAQFYMANTSGNEYIGFPNSYTFKITTYSQTYLHYGGYPHSSFNTPYDTIDSSYFANFMIIPHNYTSQYGYYNGSEIGSYGVSTSPSSIYFNAQVQDSGDYIYLHDFFIASPLTDGMPTTSIGAGIALDSGLLKEYKVSNPQYVTINGDNASATVNFIHDRYNLTVKSDIPNRFNVYNSTSSFTNNFTAHTYSNMLYNYSYKGVGLINGTGGNYYNITGNINVTHNMTLYMNYTKFNDKIIIYLTGNNVTITLFFNENFMKYDNYTMYTYNRLVINITNYHYYPAVLMANSPNGYTLSQSAMSFNSQGNYTEHLYVTTFNNNNAIDFAEANSGYIVIAMIMLGIILLPLIVRRGAGR